MAGEEPPARHHRQQQQQQQQTGIDGECLLSGLIAPLLEDLTVAVNERGRGGTRCWQPVSQWKTWKCMWVWVCGEKRMDHIPAQRKMKHQTELGRYMGFL